MVRAAPSNSSNRGGIRSDGAQIAEWFGSIPFCTRYLLGTTGLITLLCGLHVVPMYQLVLLWPQIIQQFQVWRTLTTFLLSSLSINGLLHIIMLYQHSLALETEEFAGRTADYAWFLIFSMLSILSVSWITGSMVHSYGLLLAIVTLWALRRSEQTVKFFLGFKFPARYLPYALMGFDCLMNGGQIPFSMVYGWGAAQAYYYLSVELPAQGRLNYIPTPQFVYRMFGMANRTGPGSARTASSGRTTGSQRPGGDGHFWGSGRRMG
ncbi:DER1-domain-containing protein [Coemansia reversa NRRL 1564]|uniref:Derlin n=1 Tax=Coemansia reversa (strain ATCC 12441 / NRRL 1564) TaxID=763665 RepID=A0A2G5B8Y6_COERN|nr:DER1-domain-containing protein [Coemansia reversa NRRL 1564]|eukprot:PIA15442.1 DER1-domain-containing protein [Coemansia reversa NRRL 1564]